MRKKKVSGKRITREGAGDDFVLGMESVEDEVEEFAHEVAR